MPEAGPGEVLVSVRAAGVDRGVWHLMTGLPYPIRLAGYGLRAPKNPVLGMDLAGVVTAVGDGVTRFQVGDEVLGIGKGTFAEHARALEDKLVHKPAGLSFEQAAAVAVSGLAALQAVRDHGRVQPGDRVLVIGASGGVGSYAVQLAKAFGAEVTGVASSTKLDLVRSLGADHVIDYAREDFADGARSYDVIVDIGGNSPTGAPPAGHDTARHAGHHRRGDRRQVARRQRPPAARQAAVTLRRSAADDVRQQGEPRATCSSSSRSSRRAGSPRRSTGPSRSARRPRRSGTSRTATRGARSS